MAIEMLNSNLVMLILFFSTMPHPKKHVNNQIEGSLSTSFLQNWHGQYLHSAQHQPPAVVLKCTLAQ